jgi:aldose 1-epimerase
MTRVASALVIALTFAAAAAAQTYSAERTGDVVRLTDARSQTTVSIVPAVGNIAFELSVKGQNVLRWPFTSVEECKTKPSMSGIPFLAPFANRLDEAVFYGPEQRPHGGVSSTCGLATR